MWVNKIGFYCGQTVKDKNVQSSGENKNYNFVCVCPNKKKKERKKQKCTEACVVSHVVNGKNVDR